MGDWMFDDGSAASLLEHDLWEPVGAFQPEPPPPTSDSGFGELYSWGNDDPPVDEVDEVVIIGFPSGSSGGVGGGGGRGGVIGDYTDVDGDPVDRQPIEPERSCTPPPANKPTPEGIDIEDLRNFSENLADDLYAMTNAHPENAEFGAFVYELNGQLFRTEPFTSHSEDIVRVSLGSDTLPDGARLVAWVHTHPDNSMTTPQDRFSRADVNVLDAIADVTSAYGWGWTGDENVMAYVKPHGGATDDNTYEFYESDYADRPGLMLGPCYGD